MKNYHDIIINLAKFLTLEEFYSFIGCSKSMITVPKEYSLLILNSYFPNWETDDFYDENCINGLNNLYQLKRECSRYNLGEKSEYILNRRNDKYMIIPIFEKYKDLCHNNESTKYYSDSETLDCVKNNESVEYYSDDETLDRIEHNKYAYNIKPRDGDMYIFLNDKGECTEEWYYFEEEDILISKSDKDKYFYWPVFPMDYYGFGKWNKVNIKFIFDDDMMEELHKNSDNEDKTTKLTFKGKDIYLWWNLDRGDPHSISQYIDMINRDFPFYLEEGPEEGPEGYYYEIMNPIEGR